VYYQPRRKQGVKNTKPSQVDLKKQQEEEEKVLDQLSSGVQTKRNETTGVVENDETEMAQACYRYACSFVIVRVLFGDWL
jgi:hypothetical protein